MNEKIKSIIENLKRSPGAVNIWEHFIKPLSAALFMAFFYFVIIYYKDEGTRVRDSFFLLYVLFLPLVINIAVSFVNVSKQRKGALYGLSAVAVPFTAIAFLHMRSDFYSMPAFFTEFQAGGSFYLLYIMYSVFFVIAGVFLGLVDEFMFSEEKRVSIKSGDGTPMTKAKRRKLKKKKRDAGRLDESKKQLLNEIIGPGEEKKDGSSEDGESEEEYEFVEDDGDEEDTPAEAAAPKKVDGGGNKKD